VSPEVFIPIAERTGLILPLGEWVLRESFQQLQRWDRQSPPSSLILNVNISTRQLERPGLLAVVDELLADGLDPARLGPGDHRDRPDARRRGGGRDPQQLRARGVRLAVDDFGTGYSSLSRLQAAPLSQLKIDQSFVSEITSATSPVPIIRPPSPWRTGWVWASSPRGSRPRRSCSTCATSAVRRSRATCWRGPQDASAIGVLLAGPLPWAGLLVGGTGDAFWEQHVGTAQLGSAAGGLRPPQVVQAAEAIAAAAAAEVAADAAVTAQAAVTAACSAALKAAHKAERFALLAAQAAAGAATSLVTETDDVQLRRQRDATADVGGLSGRLAYAGRRGRPRGLRQPDRRSGSGGGPEGRCRGAGGGRSRRDRRRPSRCADRAPPGGGRRGRRVDALPDPVEPIAEPSQPLLMS
jgi:hypothetical protein